MHIRFEPKYQLEMVTLFPGEYHATQANRIIATILGSCIAVVLFDPVKRVTGMNHFMLPNTISEERFYLSKSGKYGMYAMELLINELLKLGAARSQLKAKVFGGGSVLKRGAGSASSVPENNIRFTFEYLEAEKIPVLSKDVGGTVARKVLLFTETTKVQLKRIVGSRVKPLESVEQHYLDKLQHEREKEGEVTLF